MNDTLTHTTRQTKTYMDYELKQWPIFYSAAQANIKDNLWLDLVLNECFMIQCCSPMAELESVMSS